MRLGQLSRKLSVKAGEIVAFLSSNGIIVEDHVNSRISDADTRLVIGHFAPEMKLEEGDTIGTETGQTAGETVAMVEQSVLPSEEIAAQESIGTTASEITVLQEPVLSASESFVVEPEVIKAPKVELQGLKVVGKIELPEPKKKQSDESVVEGTLKDAGNATPKPDRRGRGERRSSQTASQSSPGTRKNPVARQRERESREAKERKEAELQRKKESRTQFYQQRVKSAPPVRKVNIYDEPLSQLQDEAPDEPKTLWGKFIKWLTSY